MHPVPKDEKSFRKMVKICGYSFVGIGIVFLVFVIFI